MIDEKELIEQIKSLRVTITGLRAGKSILNEYAQHFKDSVIKIIDEQPKVGEWIPVSERLPDKPGSYRVTCLYADKWYRVIDALFYSDKTWAYDNIYRERKVIAWKEIEEPYKKVEK